MATAHDLLEKFGTSAHLRAYASEILVDGDIVQDFRQFVRQQLGLALPPPGDRITKNISLSAEACALLQIAKSVPGHTLADRDPVLLRGRLFKFGGELRGARFGIPEHWRGWINAANRERWNALVAGLDYDDGIKSRLRLPDLAPSGSVSRTDVQLWIMSHYDPDFALELAKLWTASLISKGSPAKGVIAWLNDSPTWMRQFDRTAFAGRGMALEDP